MINISKKNNLSNEYVVYHTTKHNIGRYLNTWFLETIKKNNNYYYYKTCKKVDKDTASHLYWRFYNPVSIYINCTSNKCIEHHMKAMIHSIDDSSYGIWFEKKTIEEYLIIKDKIMLYLDSKKILNGDDYLNHCILLGANKETIDYN